MSRSTCWVGGWISFIFVPEMKRIILFLLIIKNCSSAFSQKEDYVWRLGDNGGINFNGGVDTFSVPNPNFYLFNETNASTCDSSGNLLLFTNGIVLFNANSDTALNGDSLNPSESTTMFEPVGLGLPQADLILRKPATSNIYYLFHETFDSDTASIYPLQTNILYYSIIDITLDSGRGGIISGKKNLHFYDNDTLLPGKLTAMRHGNGRDWWLISKRACYPEMIEWLITPDTILGPYIVTLANDPNTCYDDIPGQACFSPQGDKYAIYYGSRNVYSYEFDRCSGNLTETFHTYVADSVFTYPYGCAFSPSGKYLYLTTTLAVYQFDMTASNISASMIRVALYDGFNSPSPPFATHFCFMKLAPDNKIYISTDNGCDVMHRIEFPDSAGIGCNVLQHSFYMPTVNVSTVPNIPDYKLGALVGSGCDTILGIKNLSDRIQNEITVSPNPAHDNFTVHFSSQLQKSQLEIFNVLGEKIYSANINSFPLTLNCESFPAGIYLVKVQSTKGSANQKLVIE